jgi:hypothetical protein
MNNQTEIEEVKEHISVLEALMVNAKRNLEIVMSRYVGKKLHNTQFWYESYKTRMERDIVSLDHSLTERKRYLERITPKIPPLLQVLKRSNNVTRTEVRIQG